MYHRLRMCSVQLSVGILPSDVALICQTRSTSYWRIQVLSLTVITVQPNPLPMLKQWSEKFRRSTPASVTPKSLVPGPLALSVALGASIDEITEVNNNT